MAGTAQLAAGRDASADASFREAVEHSRDRAAATAQVAVSRGSGLLLANRVAEAAASYEIAASAGMPDAYAGLAACRLRQGQPDEAAMALLRAVELGYPAATARMLRAQILVDEGRADEAEELAREVARERIPSDLAAAYTLAYVLATAQRPGAEDALRWYAALRPDDADLPALLARPGPDGRPWRDRLSLEPRSVLPPPPP